MAAVRFGPAGKLTLVDGVFSPRASNIVHPDHTSTCTEKVKTMRCVRTMSKTPGLMDFCCSPVSQHPTNDISIFFVPDVVTHRSPSTFMQHLHTAFMRT
ncbi:hypothetical protein GOODEAATRI_016932 [Goodea atripinnis]|uniref:Uncharacterized protein n=1 Tax=Goodea atripinnis TaxID=208336 RepID=A0ABV0P4Z0_9TELE